MMNWLENEVKGSSDFFSQYFFKVLVIKIFVFGKERMKIVQRNFKLLNLRRLSELQTLFVLIALFCNPKIFPIKWDHKVRWNSNYIYFIINAKQGSVKIQFKVNRGSIIFIIHKIVGFVFIFSSVFWHSLNKEMIKKKEDVRSKECSNVSYAYTNVLFSCFEHVNINRQCFQLLNIFHQLGRFNLFIDIL